MKFVKFSAVALGIVLGLTTLISAGEAEPSLKAEAFYAIDNFFLFICAVLVLFMQAGFAMVEAGFNSSKNTVNILFKNLMDLCLGGILFYFIGYGLMYPGFAEGSSGILGFAGFGIGTASPTPAGGALHPQVDFLFQVAFAATAATIVSGAVAGRMKFVSYIIYSMVITAFIYPISGAWKWGGGWLDQLGFYDFAGSIIVHAVGGFAGLAGAMVLGARKGRFSKDGKSLAMPGHNMVLGALGVFILWIGWYGFNPGSQLALAGTDNVNAVMIVAVNTTLAAAAGGIAAMLLSWILFKKPDFSFALNGVLGGLVGITANCDSVTNISAIIIGLVAGILIIFGAMLLDKLKIDDPVGAFPVHGLTGIWGGLATGIFSTAKMPGGAHAFMPQLIGTVAIVAWSFITMFLLFKILKAMGILRVTPEEEREGLDISEHGMEAYNDFVKSGTV